MIPSIPTGSDPATAAAVNRYIMAQYMERIARNRTEIRWEGPIYTLLFAGTLILFFFAVVFWLRPARGLRPALMELTSFAGQLTERVGELRRFDVIAWTVVTTYAAYFAVKAILVGIVY